MSLLPEPVLPIPEETARVVKAAFPKSHPYLRVRDEFGHFFQDGQFAALFAAQGPHAESPARLALVTVLQFAEGLSDRQAAEAVRSRLDWKYLLGLELTDPGFDYSVLCEFRARLVERHAEALLFETLLTHFRERKLLKARGKQRTDATHVLAVVRGLNRLETVGETMRHALNVLAEVAPEWLLSQHEPEWAARYGPRMEEYRLPKGDEARTQWAEQVGADGAQLLAAVGREARARTAWAWLREVPALETLRRVWLQQFTWAETPSGANPAGHAAAGSGARLRWRAQEELPSATQVINSPYDAEARYGRKRGMSWVGYKAHVTESCDPDTPSLITDVATTPAAAPDGSVLPEVHQALAARALLPAIHLVDSGYVDADVLVSSQKEHGIDLCGPPLANTQWQAKQAAGFSISDFVIDWEAKQATCPAGQTSSGWQRMKEDAGTAVIRIEFGVKACGACPLRQQCTRSTKGGRRLTVRLEAQHRALEAARARAATEAFAREYAARAGVEGTLSQGVRRCGLRRCRYVGQLKTHLEHLLIAAGLNLVRVAHWLTDPRRARTRQSAYLRLLACAPQPT